MRRAFVIAGLALGVLLPTPAAAAVTPRQISIDPYTNPSGQHETAVEPDSFSVGNTVVAAFQVGRIVDGAASGIGWATSRDGGATWRSGVLPALTVRDSPAGPFTRVTDPAVAYDRVHGVWLVSVLALDDVPGFGPTSTLVVSRSTDGLSWSEPVVTAPDLGFFVYDKNWIACDNGAASRFAGRCYVTWTDVRADGAVAMSTSADGGLTWAPAVIFERANVSGTQPVVQPDGTVVVPYVTLKTIEVLRSTDGGETFTLPARISSLTFSATPGVRAPPLPSVEVNAEGRVFVAWPDCRFRTGCERPRRTPNDILLSSSLDGVRWSAPVRVPPDPAARAVDRLLPGLGVDATTRGASTRLALVYATLSPAGCAPSACRLGISFVSSKDAGGTWSAPLALGAPTRIDALANTTTGRFVGDYLSTSFVTGGVAVPVYSIATRPFDGGFHQFVFAARVPPQPAVRPAIAIARLQTLPARPRSGRSFTVAATLRVAGAPQAARVLCRARLGGRVLLASASRLSSGRATCVWRIPAGAAGRRLAGSVQVEYAGGVSRRAFSYVVAS